MIVILVVVMAMVVVMMVMLKRILDVEGEEHAKPYHYLVSKIYSKRGIGRRRRRKKNPLLLPHCKQDRKSCFLSK
ncbi:hypothetical protein [Candidatus Nitrosocosmicus franklandus]|uniref:Uncharacterized protein n=1 Tax=Candidatus Nitrosocosmicus franklandianus TaxID=1798806 RepID=A0A484IE69_9ARCH|nr:hypothetical protein [Candidatus Nitrosocosmicus franklandus]VFJ15107.1 protein of unknown function [Candidatus Nitrosocosmicus franklandus]